MKQLAIYLVLLLLVSGNLFAQQNTVVDSLKTMLTADLTDEQRVDIYNAIAHEYRNQDSSLTASFTQEAIQLSDEIGYPAGKSDAYYCIGWATMIKGHYAISEKLFQTALAVAQEGLYKKGEATAFNGLGVISYYQGDFPNALDRNKQCISRT